MSIGNNYKRQMKTFSVKKLLESFRNNLNDDSYKSISEKLNPATIGFRVTHLSSRLLQDDPRASQRNRQS